MCSIECISYDILLIKYYYYYTAAASQANTKQFDYTPRRLPRQQKGF